MKRFLLAFIGLLALAGGFAWAGPQPGVNSPYFPVWSIPIDSTKWTYALGFSLSPSVVATDIFQLCGDPASTAVTRVTRIAINGRATAVTSAPVFIVKRSTPTLGGLLSIEIPFLSATTTGIPMDTSGTAIPGKAVASAWTNSTVPVLTLGTLVGVIASAQLDLANLTTGLGTPGINFDWGNRPSMAPVLRGPNQCLAINLSSGTYSGNLFDITVEWTEE